MTPARTSTLPSPRASSKAAVRTFVATDVASTDVHVRSTLPATGARQRLQGSPAQSQKTQSSAHPSVAGLAIPAKSVSTSASHAESGRSLQSSFSWTACEPAAPPGLDRPRRNSRYDAAQTGIACLVDTSDSRVVACGTSPRPVRQSPHERRGARRRRRRRREGSARRCDMTDPKPGSAASAAALTGRRAGESLGERSESDLGSGKEDAMAHVVADRDTTVSPQRVIDALTDFSPKRLGLWPNLNRRTSSSRTLAPRAPRSRKARAASGESGSGVAMTGPFRGRCASTSRNRTHSSRGATGSTR